LPGYLREPHLPRCESGRARNFAKPLVPQADPLSVLPPSQTNADQFQRTSESDAANADAISPKQDATCREAFMRIR
jgi:hypothetical protein